MLLNFKDPSEKDVLLQIAVFSGRLRPDDLTQLNLSHFIENLKLLTIKLTKNSSAVFSFSALAHSRGPGAVLPEQNWDRSLWKWSEMKGAQSQAHRRCTLGNATSLSKLPKRIPFHVVAGLMFHAALPLLTSSPK